MHIYGYICLTFWLVIFPTVTARKLVESFKKMVITLKIILVFVRC